MEHVWNFYWVGGRCPCDPTYCPKTQTLDRPHFTDATTEASVLRTGHTASRGGFPAPTANPKTPRPASDHCAHCPRLGTESPALAVGTARARRRPPLCWGRRECPGQPAAAEGRAGAPRALALQPRAPGPAAPPRGARLPCAGPPVAAAASGVPKARSSERTGAGQPARPPPRPRISLEARFGPRPPGAAERRAEPGGAGGWEGVRAGAGLRGRARAGHHTSPPLRRAGAPRGAALTLISPDPPGGAPAQIAGPQCQGRPGSVKGTAGRRGSRQFTGV